MKKRTILFLILIACLLSSGSATAQVDRQGPEPAYQVERILPGSEYSLSGAYWGFVGEARSGSYQLASQPSGPSDALACCCLYFPCIKRSP
jgi:hypothetical protein